MGDSAGGNLAVRLLLMLYERDGIVDKDLGLCLISPWLDLFSRSNCYERNKFSGIPVFY